MAISSFFHRQLHSSLIFYLSLTPGSTQGHAWFSFPHFIHVSIPAPACTGREEAPAAMPSCFHSHLSLSLSLLFFFAATMMPPWQWQLPPPPKKYSPNFWLWDYSVPLVFSPRLFSFLRVLGWVLECHPQEDANVLGLCHK